MVGYRRRPHAPKGTRKTNLRQRITVPSEVMDVLRWHVDTQLTTLRGDATDRRFSGLPVGRPVDALLAQGAWT
jgi:hypothetical protein